jgi:S1-C subfamily serine protease
MSFSQKLALVIVGMAVITQGAPRVSASDRYDRGFASWQLAQAPATTKSLTPQQISLRAKQVTVRIDGQGTGSGVIIGQSGQSYTVLTNWHVVESPGEYTVQTPDGRTYAANYNAVKRLPGVDLAIIQFNTDQNYQIAEIGNSDAASEGMSIYYAGYPGSLRDESDRFYRFFPVSIVAVLPTPTENGYSLVYNGEALTGMSGGPVLDQNGFLIGIHGQAFIDPRTGSPSVYAVPINTYKQLAQKAQSAGTTAATPQAPATTASTPTATPQKPTTTASGTPASDTNKPATTPQKPTTTASGTPASDTNKPATTPQKPTTTASGTPASDTNKPATTPQKPTTTASGTPASDTNKPATTPQKPTATASGGNENTPSSNSNNTTAANPQNTEEDSSNSDPFNNPQIPIDTNSSGSATIEKPKNETPPSNNTGNNREVVIDPPGGIPTFSSSNTNQTPTNSAPTQATNQTPTNSAPTQATNQTPTNSAPTQATNQTPTNSAPTQNWTQVPSNASPAPNWNQLPSNPAQAPVSNSNPNSTTETTSNVDNSDSLLISSVTGIDYRPLRDLLLQKKWQEADLVTGQLFDSLVLLARTRNSSEFIDPKQVSELACLDISTMNQLWEQSSEGHFGFRQQQQIWTSLATPGNYSTDQWRGFATQLGWKQGDVAKSTGYLLYDQLKFDPVRAPVGHLPWWFGYQEDYQTLIKYMFSHCSFDPNIERQKLEAAAAEAEAEKTKKPGQSKTKPGQQKPKLESEKTKP